MIVASKTKARKRIRFLRKAFDRIAYASLGVDIAIAAVTLLYVNNAVCKPAEPRAAAERRSHRNSGAVACCVPLAAVARLLPEISGEAHGHGSKSFISVG